MLGARDVTITALKVVQADLEKKLAEAREMLRMSEAHAEQFAKDCSAKDSLIQNLEHKLRQQDKQWEQDVASLSAQVAGEKSKRQATESKLQEAQDEIKVLSGDTEQLRKQRAAMCEEKDVLNRLQDSLATSETLEKKLQEKRDDSNAIDAAKTKKEEEIAELNKQLKFYVHEAEVAADETKKWAGERQKLELEINAVMETSSSLGVELDKSKKSIEQLETHVARLTRERDSATAELSQTQAIIKKLEVKIAALTEQLQQEQAGKQKAESELKDTRKQIESLKRDLAKESADKAKLQEKEAKLDAALKKSETEKAKEKEHVDYYKLELKRAGDELSLLKVKYEDEMVSRKKMEKSRDEYLSKVSTTTEKLKKESTTAENITGQVKVLTKTNAVLETDVTRLSAQVEKLDAELKGQRQLRKNADTAVANLTENQKKLQQEVQKLKDAKSKLEAAEVESLQNLTSATAERNSADQKYKKIAAELKELQPLLAKEQGLKSQFRTKAEESAAKIEDLEASHTVLHGEKKNLHAELNMTKKLITDLEQKIKEQDEQWSNDVTLLKEKLQTAKAEWTKQHNEAVDLKQKKTLLETQIEKMVAEIATFKLSNTKLQKNAESALHATEAGRKAVEAAEAAKKASTEAAEVFMKEKEVAVAKAKES